MEVADGAYGTLLAPHLRPGELADDLCIRSPSDVIDAHRAYLGAGATVIQTNSFLAWRLSDRRRADTYRAALACAREAIGDEHGTDEAGSSSGGGSGAHVVATIGPAGSDPRAFWRDLELLLDEGVRDVVCETVTDADTAAAFLSAWSDVARGLRGARATLSLSVSPSAGADGWIWIGRLDLPEAGTDPALDAVCLGLNCCEGPAHLEAPLRTLATYVRPLSLVPSAGVPQLQPGEPARYSWVAEPWAEAVLTMLSDVGDPSGAPLDVFRVGGCCGTTPDHVAALAGLAGATQA